MTAQHSVRDKKKTGMTERKREGGRGGILGGDGGGREALGMSC